MSANFFLDNDDLQFHFNKAIDWASLAETTEFGFTLPGGPKDTDEGLEVWREVATMVGELVGEEIAPRSALLDKQHAHLVDGEAVVGQASQEIFAKLNAVDLHKLCLPRDLGGMNAPLMLYFLVAEMIARADVSTMTHHSFHGGMALAALIYSITEGTTTFDREARTITKTRFSQMIEEIARGESWGCMDITEPDAGSDMAKLRTRAEKDADGVWRVSGNKIFITSGHGKWHFVIARTSEAKGDDAAAGLKGLSMFLVKAYDDMPDGSRKRYVTIDRLEEKLGHNASCTAALTFDRVPGELIGELGEGFKYMLVLMNNARLGVGFEGIGIAEAALRMSKDYADGRKSMGKSIAQHEMIADMLDEMTNDVKAMRSLAMRACFHEEMAQKINLVLQFEPPTSADERRALEKKHKRHAKLARRFTPLLKYWTSEKAVECARRAIQIHGGSGYTKDYGAEKLLRDALVLPIYEGTSQIQSLMAMKDTLGRIIKDAPGFMREVATANWKAVSARDELERRVAKLQSDSLAMQRYLVTKTATGKLRTLGGKPVGTWQSELTKAWDPKRDFAWAMLHAERLTRILSIEAMAEILLDEAQQFPERRAVLEVFLERAEIEVRSLTDQITSRGGRLLASLGRIDAPSSVADAAQ
jgi:alkylation response protein AidB-like acyl-CoA dehydrogenase